MSNWADDDAADGAGGSPQPGGLDFGSLFGAANDMLAAQQAAAEEELIGSAGGGVVQITVTGGGEFTAVRILPDAIDPTDRTILEDLVLVALRDAMGQVQELQSRAMGGLDLGSLSGLLGAGLGDDPDDDDTP